MSTTVADAADWFEREYRFAEDAHEMTPALDGDIRMIFWIDPYGPAEAFGPVASADRYARAAQLIACTRGTCGGPNERHDHMVASPYPAP